MPDNKNQHYVPRCYLKAFTKDGQGTAINVYNISRDRLIPSAPVKSQCAKDYFYGNDLLLERGLQPVEAAYGVLISELKKKRTRLSAQQEQFLREFWVLQQLRTDAASKLVLATEDSIRQALGDANALPAATEEQAIRIALSELHRHVQSVGDLSIRLILNRSDVPFITCDDPQWSPTDGMTWTRAQLSAVSVLPPAARYFYCRSRPSSTWWVTTEAYIVSTPPTVG